MTLVIVGLVSAGIGIGLWLLIVGKTVAPISNASAGSSPSGEPSASTNPTGQPSLPFLHLGGHAEIVMQHNILPGTAHIEATDHAKGNLSDNFFYQTSPMPANPQAPDFIGKIWIISMNYAETSEKPLIIFALLEIKNRGSPSVVDEFHATLKVNDRVWEIQRSQRLPRDLTILRDDNTKIKTNEADMFYSKLASGNPVVQGAQLAGWLLFELKGGPIDPPKFEFTIYFSDVNGKEYSIRTTTDELSKTFVPFVPVTGLTFSSHLES